MGQPTQTQDRLFPMRSDEILAMVKGPRVLDVGCAGHIIRPDRPDWLHGRLRERFEVTGIDISESNVAQLRALGYTNIHVASAESFDLGRLFDTVVAGEVIEHLCNPGQFLTCARQHLRPDGRLVLSTPYGFSLMYAAYAAYHYPRTCENREHTCWYCPATVTELARRAGFVIETLRLIDDYDPHVKSLKYRAYWAVLRALGWLLPEKMRKTTMLLVLRCA